MTTRGEVALPKDKPRFRDLQIQGNRDTRAHSHTHSLKLARARTHASINLIFKDCGTNWPQNFITQAGKKGKKETQHIFYQGRNLSHRFFHLR